MYATYYKKCNNDVALRVYLILNRGVVLNIREVLDRNSERYKATVTINIPMKISTYRNYFMFDTPSQKPDQNSQL